MSRILTLVALTATATAVVLAMAGFRPPQDAKKEEAKGMSLGAFSVSLSVKDLAASSEFYGKLGFKPAGGNAEQNWLILRNADDHVIGLFQGMFEGNIMTFNPGWSNQAKNLKEFTDIRDVQRQLKAAGLELATEADLSTKGPASVTLMDPDGNAILIDQHR